jgi:uncharacterized glyoxalase superfamily protein PhnB
MDADARLLVVEGVYPPRIDESAESRGAAANDVNMLVCTGGRQRSEAEFHELYGAAGFRLTRIVRTMAMACVIEGVKAWRPSSRVRRGVRADERSSPSDGEKEAEMSTLAKKTTATIVPCLRYRDAPAAIDWLCRTFGFEQHLVVPGDDGTVAHAQLRFGNGMVMLGSVARDGYGRLVKQPDEIGGAETQSAYVIVTDADAVYARAKAAGARIAIEIKDEDYGGRGFSCYDLEGHLWNFGTYDPW